MGSCEILQRYSGTKSEKIMEMINERLAKEAEKDLPKLAKDKKLANLYKKYAKARKDAKEFKQQLDDRKEDLGIEWRTIYTNGKSRRAYRINSTCRIPCVVKAHLQRAEDYSSLGNKKAAQQIWQMIIDKYKLFEGEAE